jgi:serine phosphatase RsbU (regulator of sigma subunit)
MFTGIISAQVERADTVFLFADSISDDGFVLENKEWKYHEGDNPEWALPDFDDSSWEFRTSRFGKTDSLGLTWKGIGWFRKRINIDSSLTGIPLMFQLIMQGSAEVFWDGKRVGKFGSIGKTANTDTLFYNYFGKPIVLCADSAGTHLIAVRYAFRQRRKWYESWSRDIGFYLRIGSAESLAFEEMKTKGVGFGLNGLIAGLFFSLFILYFLLFLFYSRKVENLYYSLFTLGIAILLAGSVIKLFFFKSFLGLGVIQILQQLAIILIFLSYLGFLYSIFYSKKPFYYRIMIAVGAVIVFLQQFFPQWQGNSYLLVIFIVILTLEGLRVIIGALSRRQKNAWILGTGVLLFVALILLSVTAGIFNFNISGFLGVIIFFTGLFALPLTMSIYLAKSIAETNDDLEKQLETVKALSAKEIKHQKNAAEMAIRAEKEKAAAQEAKLRAQAAELQAKAAEAESRVLRVENERKSKELEAARKLQLSMLPQKLPEHPEIEISVFMQTATEVGGDYYDFLLDDEGALTVVVGDATGHGLNAGMVVTATKSLFNAEAQRDDLREILTVISDSLVRMKFGLLFMSLLLLRIKNNKLQISAAGMPPALIYRGRQKKVEEILLKSLPLGSKIAGGYKLVETEFYPGDTIFLYSDGFPELFNSENEMYGYENVIKAFRKLADQSPDKIIAGLKNICREWSNGEVPNDDVTFVVLRRKREQ